ncbi:uncharacterized protein LOC133185121 [Saccostrea echinata]|uniref:uncharacterized protein LOC133185121 n=1 Tax=Saccostrea echinata TaxID=191078 RepID=UPI002A80A13A|nr:uncharacterized protein LOC133185121 [Saccostrea echinata]
MCVDFLLSILCLILVFNQVFSVCDITNGPSGNTGCVYSPSYSKFQAAVCLPKEKIVYSTGKHLTCRGSSTKYCWYQCTATASHGGLSACQCDPNSPSVGNSDTPNINCYFPSGDCSWFSECLTKRKPCPAVTEASRTCQKLEKSAKEISKNGKAWVIGVIKCMQNNLVHLLYPQIRADCEKVKSILESSTKYCYTEPLVDNHFCELSWDDIFQIDGFVGGVFSKFKRCLMTTYVPIWAKQLLFYVENYNTNELDKLAEEIAETLSQSFQWSESGVKYKTIGPTILPTNVDSVPIRIYLYSESKNEKLVLKTIDDLKERIAEGDIATLKFKKGEIVKVTHVIGCNDPQCLSNSFSMQTECSGIAKTLSCEILEAHKSDKLTLLGTHVRQDPPDDGADALRNIQDACEGKTARRSSYSCEINGETHTSPGGTVCLDELILQYVIDLQKTAYKPQINSLAGSCHTTTSLHYSGMAVDLQLNKLTGTNLRDPDQEEAYKQACSKAGGWSHGGTHVHCQIINLKQQSTKTVKGDSECTNLGGECKETSVSCNNGRFETMLCSGRSSRQCCIPNSGNYDCFGDVTKLTPSGRKNGGIPASINEITPDLKKLTEKKSCYVSAGENNCVHPAVIAAIASRESHAGRLLINTNGWGDNDNAYGTMQCDVRHCPVCDKTTGQNCTTYNWDSCEHINMMTKFTLVKFIKEVQKKHPNWALEQQLQGGVAAYNFGVGNVQSWGNLDIGSTNNDYSNDVIARAHYLINQHGW